MYIYIYIYLYLYLYIYIFAFYIYIYYISGAVVAASPIVPELRHDNAQTKTRATRRYITGTADNKHTPYEKHEEHILTTQYK